MLDVKNALKLRQHASPVKIHDSWMKPLKLDRPVVTPARIDNYLKILRKSGQWMTYQEIADKVGCTKTHVRQAAPLFYRYCKLGTIERRDVPQERGGLPVVQYRWKHR